MIKSRMAFAAVIAALLHSCGNPGDGNIDNGIANYAGPHPRVQKNLDQVASQPAVLTISPLPFAPNSSIQVSASLDRPFLPVHRPECGAQPTYEYRFRIVGLDAQGNAIAGASSAVATKPVEPGAEGARTQIQFDPLTIEALETDPNNPGPNARARVNLYSRVCTFEIVNGQPEYGMKESDDTILAELDLRYSCGRRTDPCRYALA